MAIYVDTIAGLPLTPTPYNVLSSKCKPVFTRMTFFNDIHTLEAHSSSARCLKLPIKKRHLVLPGLLDENTLKDCLLTQKLRVEVHDRDLRYPDDIERVAKEVGADGKIKSDLHDLPSSFGEATFCM